MAELFTATVEDGDLICGYCNSRIVNPETLVENGTARLVECKRCFRLNKVKTQ